MRLYSNGHFVGSEERNFATQFELFRRQCDQRSNLENELF